MGSPDFAVPILDALAKAYAICGVFTQPDRPSGRGMVLSSPPVKELALSLGLPIYQPVKVNDEQSYEILRDWNPDLIVVAAYGQLLKPKILDFPQFGCINVHASLLPRWRGASPIQSVLCAGDNVTGVTIMKMDVGMDTGDMLGQEELPIQASDTGGGLTTKLSHLGADYLSAILPDYLSGTLSGIPQPEEGITYAPLICKQDGHLDPLRDDALTLERKVRAFQPWPGAYLEWEGGRLKVLESCVLPEDIQDKASRFVINGWPAVATASGNLQLIKVQPAGKNPMSGKQFLCGAKNWISLP